MTKEQFEALLEKVRSWSAEEQEEFLELAREIEARQTGTYVLTRDEEAAIAKARNSGFASDDEVAAFWRKYDLG
jgi:hypothetical protein